MQRHEIKEDQGSIIFEYDCCTALNHVSVIRSKRSDIAFAHIRTKYPVDLPLYGVKASGTSDTVENFLNMLGIPRLKA